MQNILGPNILTKAGTVSTDTLAGKYVGLYFSAHWCPPCRGFTPKLSETYQIVVAKGKPFEIVFVSSDKSEGQFNDYYGEMPWAALPYADRAKKEELSKKYKVQGIPTLVILNPEGEVVTLDGRDALGNDSEGEKFPWTPPTFTEMIGDKFHRSDGTEVSYSELDGKVLGLYFSAHWCGPCRSFTPSFAATYTKMKAAGKPFEVIFVSSDRDEGQFNEYMGEMPWLALPYAKREEKAALSSWAGVSGIPTLVILDAERNIITKSGRGAIGADPNGDEFPWVPKPLVNVCADAEGLNDCPSLVLLLDDGVADQGPATAIMEALAEEYKAKRTSGESEMLTFIAPSSDGPVAQIRKLCSVPKSNSGKPTLLLLDIPDNGGFYVFNPQAASGDVGIDLDSVHAWLMAYGMKALPRKQLGQ